MHFLPIKVLSEKEGKKKRHGSQEWRGKYSAFIEDVRDVLSTYRDILSGVQEGMNFYESMQDSARQLSSKIHEHCNSRMAEKDRLVNKLGKARQCPLIVVVTLLTRAQKEFCVAGRRRRQLPESAEGV